MGMAGRRPRAGAWMVQDGARDGWTLRGGAADDEDVTGGEQRRRAGERYAADARPSIGAWSVQRGLGHEPPCLAPGSGLGHAGTCSQELTQDEDPAVREDGQ